MKTKQDVPNHSMGRSLRVGRISDVLAVLTELGVESVDIIDL